MKTRLNFYYKFYFYNYKTYFYNMVKEQGKDLMKPLRGPVRFLHLLVFYVWISILLKKSKYPEILAYTTPWHAGDRNAAKPVWLKPA